MKACCHVDDILSLLVSEPGGYGESAKSRLVVAVGKNWVKECKSFFHIYIIFDALRYEDAVLDICK